MPAVTVEQVGTSHVYTVDIEPHTTLAELKRKIYDQTHIPQSLQLFSLDPAGTHPFPEASFPG